MQVTLDLSKYSLRQHVTSKMNLKICSVLYLQKHKMKVVFASFTVVEIAATVEKPAPTNMCGPVVSTLALILKKSYKSYMWVQICLLNVFSTGVLNV